MVLESVWSNLGGHGPEGRRHSTWPLQSPDRHLRLTADVPGRGILEQHAAWARGQVGFLPPFLVWSCPTHPRSSSQCRLAGAGCNGSLIWLLSPVQRNQEPGKTWKALCDWGGGHKSPQVPLICPILQLDLHLSCSRASGKGHGYTSSHGCTSYDH